jgi:uncharacterized ferredoxin-like protein
MITNERDIRKEHLLSVARQMMNAARTAPKGKGVDIIEIAAVSGEDDIRKLSELTRKKGEETGLKFMLRDAENILQANVIVLIGSRVAVHGLNCGYCGVLTCEEKLKNEAMPCAINMVDLGIAVGSAVATAADLRVDTRVMFSVGFAIKTMGYLPDCHSIYAIPVSASSKNPFFDRKPKEQSAKK